MKTVKLMIVGFGNIGRGLAKTLLDKKASLKKAGVNLVVVAVCEAAGCAIDEKGLDLKRLLSGQLKWSKKKTLDVISCVDADIVVELTPGNIKTGQPGLSHIRCALKSKKHVVTSNKSPIVLAYHELVKLAGENDVSLRFEATVGGAIPIISSCERDLSGNMIKNIYGILNGTTNYILTKMDDEGIDFESALAEAKQLGYAESDPTYDISGLDTASKIVILANALMDANVTIADISVTGIENITPEAVEVAKEYGYTIKLIGDVAKREVSPKLLPMEHTLNVGGSLNAILVDADLAGEVTLVGHGAGPMQTSSAILSDILAIAKDRI